MRKVIKKEFICKTCGKKFLYYDWIKRIPKYCSKECWQKRSPKVLRECLWCGKEMYIHPSTAKIQKYCSKKCYSLHLEILKSGSNSPFWKGGITPLNTIERTRMAYHKWRDAIYLRDNYTCQKCGIRSSQKKRIYLQAHHIKSFAKNKNLRYKIKNGLTLCKNCHFLEHHHKFLPLRLFDQEEAKPELPENKQKELFT